MLGAIWAQSLDRVIGDGKHMPWHIPEDLAHFKQTTLGDPVLMGRRTWESLPAKVRPLPGRDNIVLSSRTSGDWSRGAQVVADVADLAGFSGWIMGGARLYAAALDHVDRLELTLIDAHLAHSIAPAVLAPEVGDEFEVVAESEWLTSERGTVSGQPGPARYRFLSYMRKERTA